MILINWVVSNSRSSLVPPPPPPPPPPPLLHTPRALFCEPGHLLLGANAAVSVLPSGQGDRTAQRPARAILIARFVQQQVLFGVPNLPPPPPPPPLPRPPPPPRALFFCFIFVCFASVASFICGHTEGAELQN